MNGYRHRRWCRRAPHPSQLKKPPALVGALSLPSFAHASHTSKSHSRQPYIALPSAMLLAPQASQLKLESIVIKVLSPCSPGQSRFTACAAKAAVAPTAADGKGTSEGKGEGEGATARLRPSSREALCGESALGRPNAYIFLDATVFSDAIVSSNSTLCKNTLSLCPRLPQAFLFSLSMTLKVPSVQQMHAEV